MGTKMPVIVSFFSQRSVAYSAVSRLPRTTVVGEMLVLKKKTMPKTTVDVVKESLSGYCP